MYFDLERKNTPKSAVSAGIRLIEAVAGAASLASKAVAVGNF